jgi:serine/threonine protein kinase
VETFGQYAATRPLREHPVAPRESGGVITEAGLIRTFMGVDLVTGMPVIVYTMPAPAPRFAEMYSEHLPAILERGEHEGVGYVIVASAPGYAPLKPTLSEPRLHWLARCSVKTLFDAHSVGLVHTHLQPEHFYAQGDHLFIEGFGLPWADEQGPYRAPEGSGQPPADVFAWARSMNMFGKGDPSKLIDGELGKLIGHCLNGKPRERPTAGELVLALEQILNPKALSARPEHVQSVPDQPELISSTTSETISKPGVLEPSLKIPTPVSAAALLDASRAVLNQSSTLSEPEPLSVPEGLEADEPDVIVRSARVEDIREAAVETALEVRAEPIDSDHIEMVSEPSEPSEISKLSASPEPASAQAEDRLDDDVLTTQIGEPSDTPAPIRIGWSDDDSWRPVRAPAPPISSGPPLVVLLLGGLLTVSLLAGLVWFLRPNGTSSNSPTANPTTSVPSVVNFQFDPPQTRSGRLTVVSAPAGAKLQPGAVLATIPGPVLFTAPGTYQLRVTVEGYETTETTLQIPGAGPVILKLQGR